VAWYLCKYEWQEAASSPTPPSFSSTNHNQKPIFMKEASVDRLRASQKWFTVAPGVWGLRDVFVNIFMIHNPTTNNWVLVDAGLKWSAPRIKQMAEELFWPEVRPAAIILTHAHFDHVGSLVKLAREWDVPVYAHYMEQPYLNGQCSYPPADPTVGGGLMSAMSWMYPRGPVDISDHLQTLPEDGTIPVLPGWEYLHTPGHSPGHISLFREWDRLLIAGDAFVTTKAESAVSTMLQREVVSGPPKYFTPDWDAAEESVRKLADLNPGIVATGHGRPMRGQEMKKALQNLSENFNALAVPAHGRYVDDPAVANEGGVTYVPPTGFNSANMLRVAGLAAAVVTLVILARKGRKTGFALQTAKRILQSRVRQYLPAPRKTPLARVKSNGQRIFKQAKRAVSAALS
jgi:glyoxylase-like metal-dependent hydrolase (beta-lactamase superfamily II)